MEELAKELFLMEYEDLCKKHGAIIDSCGCCDGPSIVTKEEIIEWEKDRIMDKEVLNAFEKRLNVHISQLRAE